MKEDLGLFGNEFNIMQSMWYVAPPELEKTITDSRRTIGYVLGEIPR